MDQGTQPKRVLVVEDEAAIREILEDEFRRHGHAVIVVDSADAASTLLQSRTFDVLITDLDLPGRLSGIDLLRQAHALTPALPTVLVTGRKELIEGELTHLDLLVTKPFALTHLVDTTERFLGSLTAQQV